MSVLIEGITLVVRRLSADIAYPGGSDAFLQATLELEQPPRYVCDGDPLLLNLSFYSVEHLRPAAELLRKSGLIDVDDDTKEFLDFAYVDQASGPTMPCSWLAWKKQKEGFTLAWDTSAEMGDMAAPDDWTAQRSREMTRTDIRDDTERMFHLATEDGFDTYLDLKTGELSMALSRSTPQDGNTEALRSEESHSESESSSTEDSLFQWLTSALAALGWHPTLAKNPIAVVELAGDLAVYSCRYLVREQAFVISCVTRAPLRVPRAALRRVMEFVTRANCDMTFGAWTLDLSDGTLGIRASLNSEGAKATPAMVKNLARIGMGTLERFYPNVLELVAGRISVRQALEEAAD